jgi:thiol-disulfide isomerase/thioredoxin
VDETKPAAPPKPAADDTKPAPREMPPDQKAFNEATRITDPAKRIEAMEKFKKDFADSAIVSTVNSAILNALATSMPDQTAKIRQMAKSMYAAAAAKDKATAKTGTMVGIQTRGGAALSISNSLLGANLLLKDAESYARKSIDVMQLPLYLASQRESYAKRKQNIPPPETLTKQFQEQRASRVATLGQIEFKLGRTDLAKKLLTESYTVNNDNPSVAGVLGEIAIKQGDEDKAFDYLMTTKLSGRISDSSNSAFETIYKKRHNGSLDGLDTALDAEYNKRFPNPVQPEAYKPTEERTDRVVLAEIFTGSGCPPCVAVDLAFDAAMARYGQKNLAVVMYHQHIPRPDPMTNPDSLARAKYYSVTGVPTWDIDGKQKGGGGPRAFAKSRYDVILPEIDHELETPSEARIKIDASLAGNTVKAATAVSDVKSESKDLKLHVLLVEKELRYTGENGIRFHPMVVRAMNGHELKESSGTFEDSFDLEAVSKALKEHLDDYEAKGHRGETFKFAEKKYQIERNDLAIVVFVQDDKQHVLQAAYFDLGGHAGTRPTNEAQ